MMMCTSAVLSDELYASSTDDCEWLNEACSGCVTAPLRKRLQTKLYAVRPIPNPR